MNIEFSQQVSSDSENEGENRALQPPSQEEEVIIRDLVSGTSYVFSFKINFSDNFYSSPSFYFELILSDANILTSLSVYGMG